MSPKHVARIHLFNLVGSLKISDDLDPCSLYWCSVLGDMRCKKKIGSVSVESFQLTQRLFPPLHYLLLYILWSLNELA